MSLASLRIGWLSVVVGEAMLQAIAQNTNNGGQYENIRRALQIVFRICLEVIGLSPALSANECAKPLQEKAKFYQLFYLALI